MTFIDYIWKEKGKEEDLLASIKGLENFKKQSKEN